MFDFDWFIFLNEKNGVPILVCSRQCDGQFSTNSPEYGIGNNNNNNKCLVMLHIDQVPASIEKELQPPSNNWVLAFKSESYNTPRSTTTAVLPNKCPAEQGT